MDRSDPVTDQSDEAAEPPPAASARFPDVPPPVDQDWVLAPSRRESESARAARIHDLLAPFEKARAEREASGATAPLPPPPSSARLPDAPPRTSATRGPDGVPPQPTTPPASRGRGVSGAAPVDESPLDERAASPRPGVPPTPAAPPPTTTSRTGADATPPQAEPSTATAPSRADDVPPLPTEPPTAASRTRTDNAPPPTGRAPATSRTRADDSQPPIEPPTAVAKAPASPTAPPRQIKRQQARRPDVSAVGEDPGPVLPGRPDTVPAIRPRPVSDVSREEATRLRPVPDESTTRRDGGTSTRATAARRAVGAVDLSPGPDAGRPFVSFARPAVYDDTTTRLRPIGTWARPRAAAAVACAVLGLGLIGGAATGSWLTGESVAGGTTRSAYTVTGALWHSVPVDRLFPPELKGEGAGPGGADRSWTRIAVAPDSGCTDAFDPLLSKVLAPVGCLRLLRATYADATRSHVTTVGLLFTKADADAMQTLRNRFTEEGLDRRPDLMPRAYAAKGTAAEGFGDAQRASWTMSVLPDAPVVAYAVSGFADGRAVTDPEPATEAMGSNTTSAPAQSGLGHEAKGIADRVERGLRKTIAAAEKSS